MISTTSIKLKAIERLSFTLIPSKQRCKVGNVVVLVSGGLGGEAEGNMGRALQTRPIRKSQFVTRRLAAARAPILLVRLNRRIRGDPGDHPKDFEHD